MYSFTISLTVFLQQIFDINQKRRLNKQTAYPEQHAAYPKQQAAYPNYLLYSLVNKLHVRTSKQHIITTQAAYHK
jgi:hypothetical protein